MTKTKRRALILFGSTLWFLSVVPILIAMVKLYTTEDLRYGYFLFGALAGQASIWLTIAGVKLIVKGQYAK